MRDNFKTFVGWHQRVDGSVKVEEQKVELRVEATKPLS